MKQSRAKAIQLDDLRLQQYLYKKLKFSFTKVKKKIKKNSIYINSKRKKKLPIVSSTLIAGKVVGIVKGC